MSVNTGASGAPEDGRDPYDAALERLNTEQGFPPAAADDQPEQGGAAPSEDLTGTTDQQPGGTAPPPSPEVERLRRQYQANLEQQRQHFQQQAAAAEERGRQQAAAQVAAQQAQAMQQQAQARAEQRAEVNRRLQFIADPNDRQQLINYRDQLDQADAVYYQTENQRLQSRASTAEQAASQVAYQAQTALVAERLPTILPAYAPHIAAALQAQGQQVSEDEVRAIIARPEYVQQAQAMTYQGRDAMNAFGQMLTSAVAGEVRAARQYQQQAAQNRRGQRDASGLGRAGQAGNGAAEPPEDLGQYKSAPGKSGDFDKMLAALNKQQGIQTSRGNRR